MASVDPRNRPTPSPTATHSGNMMNCSDLNEAMLKETLESAITKCRIITLDITLEKGRSRLLRPNKSTLHPTVSITNFAASAYTTSC